MNSLNHQPAWNWNLSRENWSGKKWSGRTTFGCQNWSNPGSLLAAKNGPGCQSGPGISTCRKPFLALRSLCRTHFYMQLHAVNAKAYASQMCEHASALLIIHAGSSDMVKILKETHATASTRHISRVLPPADQKMKLNYRLYKNSRLLLS